MMTPPTPGDAGLMDFNIIVAPGPGARMIDI
jgi:hypothetical protein